MVQLPKHVASTARSSYRVAAPRCTLPNVSAKAGEAVKRNKYKYAVSTMNGTKFAWSLSSSSCRRSRLAGLWCQTCCSSDELGRVRVARDSVGDHRPVQPG